MTPTAPSLEQLRDIHLPPAIGAWPPAPGWWLLALLLLAAVTAAGLWLWRRWQRERYRREALTLLGVCRERYQRDHDQAALLAALSELLRRTALTAYPGQRVAGLSGETWREFLHQHSGLNEFNAPLGDALIHGPYQPRAELDADGVIGLTQRWIQQHRRPAC